MRKVACCWLAGLAWWVVGSQPALVRAQAGTGRPGQGQGAVIRLDDFEGESLGWKYVGGEEFPGAQGSLTRDEARPHQGKAAARLHADFGGGGAYVGVWKDLEPLSLPDLDEFRCWVRSSNVGRVGVRLVDATGQCHQGSVTLPVGSETGWQELIIKVRSLVGGEHWSGSNDGVWHGPPRGLGLNLGKNALGPGADQQATLWLDDMTAVGVAASVPTLVGCSINPGQSRPGYGSRINYVWDAEPLGANCSVFVHFVNAQGQMVFQADHDPSVPTLNWSGKVIYGRTVTVPSELTPGRYDVVVGLWDSRPANQGGGRKPFRVGPGLQSLADHACRVGTLEVATNAPLPTLPPPSLNLDQYQLSFDEDFKEPLSISAWGPGTRWIAHTPYAGDFGDAGFGEPGPNTPFTVHDGILEIKASKVGDKWRSGLICSVDPKGNGFAQKYGYFEMRARLPKGLGTWPAFWLMGVPQLVEPKDKKTIAQIEIDVVEQYGVGPNSLHTTLHLWSPDKFHWAEGDTSIVAGMTDDFHTYGVSVEEDFTTFYYDGREIRRDKTPDGAKVPLYLMVDLALGGGWPIDKTPNPSILLVDHVRVYRKK